MQKKIIVLAIAAALTAPALAFAEATVYGQVNLAIERRDDGNSPSTTANQLNSYGSRFGLKGSEALDGGMSIVWMLEGGYKADDGMSESTNQIFNRESHIGLTSDSMGTVTLGLQPTPYKAATRRLDVFGDTAADNRRLLGDTHDESVANAFSYMTPSMGGFSVAVATQFGAEKSPQPVAPNNNTKGSALGLAAMYEQGPIYAAFAIDNVKYGAANTGQLAGVVDAESKGLMLGGSYSMDAITISAEIERLTNKASATAAELKNSNFYLGAKFALSSSDAIKAAYTKVGSQTGLNNNATQVAVGYDHNMSKNTMVYALYTKITQNATGAPDPSILSVGMKHAF